MKDDDRARLIDRGSEGWRVVAGGRAGDFPTEEAARTAMRIADAAFRAGELAKARAIKIELEF